MSRLTGDDFNEVLIWADYCIARGWNRTKFEDTIIGHLKEIRYREYKLDDIHNKAREIWKTEGEGRQGESDYTQIYDHGSKALLNIGYRDSKRPYVNAGVKKLLKEHGISPSRSSRKRQRPRSKARNHRSKAINHKSKAIDHSDAKNRNRTAKKSPLRTRTLTSQNQFDSGLMNERGERRFQKSWKESVVLNLSASSASTPFNNKKSTRSRESSTTLSSVPDSESESLEDVDLLHNGVAENARVSTPTPEKSKRNSNLARQEINGLCLSRDCERLREELIECKGELEYQLNRVSEYTEKFNKMDQDLRTLQNTNKLLSKDYQASIPERLENQLRTIQTLRARLDDRDALFPFTTRNEERHIPFEKKYFESNMSMVHNAIKEFMPGAKGNFENTRLASQIDDLPQLLGRVFGHTLDMPCPLPLRTVLQAILAAAVCEWVLERDFEAHHFGSGPLRKAMLQSLTNLGRLRCIHTDYYLLNPE
jgi:hypothetical protein